MKAARGLMSLLLFFVAANATTAAPPADSYRKVWISSQMNLPLVERSVSAKEVAPACPTPWSVWLNPCQGGKQDGTCLIELNNGKMIITICPTRGMGVLNVRMGRHRLGWDSPVKEIVHPKYINLQSRGGLGWLEGFNEWMCRCGLESNGHPGLDRFINNVGEEATMELPLHGKIANIPASEVEIVADTTPPYRIRVRGRVDEKMFYGPQLELMTEVSTIPGSTTLTISDVITNRGARPQEYQMLYHTNFGSPLLEEGAMFVGPVRQITPFNGVAAKEIDRYAVYRKPTTGFIEQVYLLKLYGDANDRTEVLLRNQRGDAGASMAWSLKELPYFTIWKNTAAKEDGYVTGFEPGTNYPMNRRIERHFGRVPKLAAGASTKMSFDVTLHADRASVDAAATRIRRIHADRETRVDRQPMKLPE